MLAEPAPAAHQRYTKGMWHYARGLALAAKGTARRGPAEHDSVVAITGATPKEQPAGINSAKALLQLAERHMSGRLAAAGGDTAAAVAAYGEAMKLEDALTYDEPPAWYHPIRLELGALALAQGKAAEAERYVPRRPRALAQQRLGPARPRLEPSGAEEERRSGEGGSRVQAAVEEGGCGAGSKAVNGER